MTLDGDQGTGDVALCGGQDLASALRVAAASLDQAADVLAGRGAPVADLVLGPDAVAGQAHHVVGVVAVRAGLPSAPPPDAAATEAAPEVLVGPVAAPATRTATVERQLVGHGVVGSVIDLPCIRGGIIAFVHVVVGLPSPAPPPGSET